MYGLIDHKDEINRLLSRYGVKFGIYKDNTFHERLFPFDPIPRTLTKTRQSDSRGFCLLFTGLFAAV